MSGWRWNDAWIFVSAGHRRAAPGGTAAVHAARRSPRASAWPTCSPPPTTSTTRSPSGTSWRPRSAAWPAPAWSASTDGWFRITPGRAAVADPAVSAGLGTRWRPCRRVLNRRHTRASADWNLDEDDHAAAVQEYVVRLDPRARAAHRRRHVRPAADAASADRVAGRAQARP